MPIPHNPLRYVSVYAFALDGGGLGLLDTGWESDESWAALTGGLASIGGGVDDVRGVLVTHLHFDHLGLAARVREASGAWVAMHPADATAVAGSPPARRRDAWWPPRSSSWSSLGADRAEAVADVGPAERHGARSPAWPCPTGCWRTASTPTSRAGGCAPSTRPGHTPGHLCFAEERTGLFFSGDHVLPRISPNISTHATAAPPIRCATTSTRWPPSRDLDPAEVLPAHEWRFRGLDDRVDALTAHHEHRLTELLDAIRTAPGLARRGSWPPT